MSEESGNGLKMVVRTLALRPTPWCPYQFPFLPGLTPITDY